MKKFILVLLAIISCLQFNSCMFFEEEEPNNQLPIVTVIPITGLSMNKSTLSMKTGTMDYLQVKITPHENQPLINLTWEYDNNIIECDTSSHYGVTIAAKNPGQTSLRCSYLGHDATCIITVEPGDNYIDTSIEPYIYSNTHILQISPGVTEKVYVSLYGGSESDMNNFIWNIADDESVCSIDTNGQYCLIKGKKEGYTRIKITNPLASYPYYLGVYVVGNLEDKPYITTDSNILTLNKSDTEQNITVSIVNGTKESLEKPFTWEIISEENIEIPIDLSANNNNAVISPRSNGSCTIRIRHPDCDYPLDILCRVLTVVQNVYIEPDATLINLNGNDRYVLKSVLKNARTGTYSEDDFDYKIIESNAAVIVNSIGDTCILEGDHNGSCKVQISHPNAKYAREVLVIVDGQVSDAIDTTYYITTSQNYIRTKVGAEGTTLNISLVGGYEGDEKDIVWTVKQFPLEEGNRVINLETPGNGSVLYDTDPTRAITITHQPGEGFITPVSEGTATITVTHPKAKYATEVLIKVLNEKAILSESEIPLYFTGSGLVKVLNGSSYTYTVGLLGENKNASDDSLISWNCNDTNIQIHGNETQCEISPKANIGNNRGELIIKHPKADYEKKVLILSANTQAELDAMKALYTDKTYYTMETGNTAQLLLNAEGFSKKQPLEINGETFDIDTPYSNRDFQTIDWKISDSSIITGAKNEGSNLMFDIKALKAGTSKVTATFEGYSCEFSITVLPEGSLTFTPSIYLTTSQNVIHLKNVGDTKELKISAMNLDPSEYSSISWTINDESIATVYNNGISARIKANKEGETFIICRQNKSENELKIYVRVGSEYEIVAADPIVYISSQDIITFVKGTSAKTLNAALVNNNGNTAPFTFQCDNSSVARIDSQSPEGVAVISPVDAGQCEITISNTMAAYAKKVLVIVANTEEELRGYKYLTTSQNVIRIVEGKTQTVSVSVNNSEDIILDGYTWETNNNNIVDINASGNTNAVIRGKYPGTAVITVKNSHCQYGLDIIVEVVDKTLATKNPFIHLSASVLTLTSGDDFTSVSADLIGGDESDFSGFIWSVTDASICSVFGQNEVAKLKGLKKGTTVIECSHPKANIIAQLLVVVEEPKTSDCYISVPTSILTLKPTESSRSITASLINGDQMDKYAFKWSLDVYDVIDYDYSANVISITPKQVGTVTITCSHPKAQYSQQIIVKVQEYNEFSFPVNNMNIVEGEVKFLTMCVPVTNVATHIEYSVENPSLCSITGTKAVAQITAIKTGSTTVRARLIATSTGIEQAKAECLIYVQQGVSSTAYITSSSTICTVERGKSATLSASLQGSNVVTGDDAFINWTTSDSDIISIAGLSTNGTVRGPQIYVTAKKSGEAIITCSHSKANSNLQFYVVVPGSNDRKVTLDKNFIQLVKGNNNTAVLKASIENALSNSDYNEIVWSSSNDSVRLMGSGQSVTLYAQNIGECEVRATIPSNGSTSVCNVIVSSPTGFSFDQASIIVEPGISKIVQYTCSPADSTVTWLSNVDSCFNYEDLGHDTITGLGKLKITGLTMDKGTITGILDSGKAKSALKVEVAWDYSFVLAGKTTFSVKPGSSEIIEYQVHPANAVIDYQSTIPDGYFDLEIQSYGAEGKGRIVIRGKKEYAANVTVNLMARNPMQDNQMFKQLPLTFRCGYDTLTLNTTMRNRDGRFSYYDPNSATLYIGDGEKLDLDFSILEQEANASIEIDTSKLKEDVGASVNGNTVQVNGGEDVTEKVKVITSAYVPAYNGHVYEGWEDDLEWVTVNTNGGKVIGLVSKKHSKYKGSDFYNLPTDTFCNNNEPKYLMFFGGYHDSHSGYDNGVMLYCPATEYVNGNISKRDLLRDYGFLEAISFDRSGRITVEDVGNPHDGSAGSSLSFVPVDTYNGREYKEEEIKKIACWYRPDMGEPCYYSTEVSALGLQYSSSTRIWNDIGNHYGAFIDVRDTNIYSYINGKAYWFTQLFGGYGFSDCWIRLPKNSKMTGGDAVKLAMTTDNWGDVKQNVPSQAQYDAAHVLKNGGFTGRIVTTDAVTKNETIKDNKEAGTIRVTVFHNGNRGQSYSINVKKEIRNCLSK